MGGREGEAGRGRSHICDAAHWHCTQPLVAAQHVYQARRMSTLEPPAKHPLPSCRCQVVYELFGAPTHTVQDIVGEVRCVRCSGHSAPPCCCLPLQPLGFPAPASAADPAPTHPSATPVSPIHTHVPAPQGSLVASLLDLLSAGSGVLNTIFGALGVSEADRATIIGLVDLVPQTVDTGCSAWRCCALLLLLVVVPAASGGCSSCCCHLSSAAAVV